MPELTCFRLLDAESPAGPLAEAVRQVGAGEPSPAIFLIDANCFAQVPNAPFAYWVEDKVRKIFVGTPKLESETRAARQGLVTGDNTRYLRCWWEVPAQVHSSMARRWWPFAKGGLYSPYYSDLNQVVNWGDDGKELRSCDSARVQNSSFFYRPGLTWPKRLHKLSTYVLPSDAIISDRGSGIFSDQSERGSLLALTNSAAFNYLAKVMLGRDAHPEFVNGIVGQLPTAVLDQSTQLELGRLSLEAARLQRDRARLSESSRHFLRPTRQCLASATNLLSVASDEADRIGLIRALSEIEVEINRLVDRAYGMDEVCAYSSAESIDTAVGKQYGTVVLQSPAQRLYSYLFGRLIGRWSPDSSTMEWDSAIGQDLFAALPCSPPGSMSAEAASLYLVDDEIGELISEGMAKQITLLFGERANQVEAALAENLQVDTLRSYLVKPSGFFSDHLALYTDSPRQAPIYWPLSTRSGEFILWVYYPKLDADSLPRLITEVLDPRLRSLSEDISTLVAEGRTAGRRAKLEALRLELSEMRQDFQELIAKGYKPDLNDGVLIAACPLAKYFRHAGFRKNLEACWKALDRGDYDWSRLAMSMWPERVLEACKKDRSIAIAHGREDLCPAEQPKAPRGRKKKAD